MKCYDHCILNTHTSILECHRCGGTSPFNLPMDLDEVSFYVKKFQRKHRWCKLSEGGTALKQASKDAWDKADKERKGKYETK